MGRVAGGAAGQDDEGRGVVTMPADTPTPAAEAVERMAEFFDDRACFGFAPGYAPGSEGAAAWDALMKRRAAETAVMLRALRPAPAARDAAGVRDAALQDVNTGAVWRLAATLEAQQPNTAQILRTLCAMRDAANTALATPPPPAESAAGGMPEPLRALLDVLERRANAGGGEYDAEIGPLVYALRRTAAPHQPAQEGAGWQPEDHND